MENKKIEVFVSLTKMDTVVVLEKNILTGSLVFESLNPFPGYYHELPSDPRSMYIYMVLEKPYTLDEILRVTQVIEKQYDWNFDVGKAYLKIGTEELFAIRIRHISSVDYLEKIQKAFSDHGISFFKRKKISGKHETKVKIIKFIELEELKKGIYLSVLDNSIAYVEIPKFLNPEIFSKVSMDVKYNWDGREFDVASAAFYEKGKLLELVRIYSDKIDVDYLEAIRKLYEKKIG